MTEKRKQKKTFISEEAKEATAHIKQGNKMEMCLSKRKSIAGNSDFSRGYLCHHIKE